MLSKKIVFEGHAGAIYDVLVHDNRCFTTSADKFVARWDIELGQQDGFAVKLEASGYRIAMNPINQLFAVGNAQGGIHIIDLAQRKEVRYLTQHQSAVFALSYNPVTNHFYSGDADGFLCVWDGNTFDLLLTLPFNCGKIRNISLHTDGGWMIFGGQDGKVFILDTTFFNEHYSWKAHNDGTNVACFFKNTLITGGKDAFMRTWDWKAQKLLKEVPAHNFAIYDLLLMQNDEVLVSCSFDKTIKIWDPHNLTIHTRLEKKQGGHTHAVNRLAKISEKQFISVGDDRKIIVWEF
jgi:WD40 repeat protein